MERSSISSSDHQRQGSLGLFLLKVILFVGGLVMLLAPLCVVSLRANRQALASAAFRATPQTRIVIAGDSHVETSLNPDLIPGAINISRSAENYFYTYFKLKHFLELNPQVRTVVLGCSPHNIMDHDAQFREDRANRSKDYFMLLDNPARELLASFRLSYVVALLQSEYGIPFRLFQNPILVKHLLGRTTYSRVDFPFNGSYKSLKGTFVDENKVEKRAADHFFNGSSYVGMSSVTVDYLEKIAGLCQKHRIGLVLVDTPVAKQYQKRIPSRAFDDFRNVIAHLTEKYPGARYVDLSTLQLSPEDFFDGNHVNGRGAKTVTAEFYQRYCSDLRSRGDLL